MSPVTVNIFATVLCFGYVSAVERDYSTQPGETVLYLNNENNASLSDVYNITNGEVSFTRPLEEEEREDNRPTDDVRDEEELNYWEQFKCNFGNDVDITVIYSVSNGTFTKGDDSNNNYYCFILPCYCRINGKMSKGVCVKVFTVNTTVLAMSGVKKEEIIFGLTPGTFEIVQLKHVQFELCVKNNNYDYDDEFGGMGPLHEDGEVDGERNGLRLIKILGENESEEEYCKQTTYNIISVEYNALDGTFTQELPMNDTNCILLQGFFRVNTKITILTCVYVCSISDIELTKKFLELSKIQEIPFHRSFIIGLTERVFIKTRLHVKRNYISQFINFTYHDYIRALDINNFMINFSYQTLFVTSTISIVGNLLICAVIIKYKTMRNSPNMYVFSLSLADIATFSMTMVLDLLPPESLKSSIKNWTFIYSKYLYDICRNVNVWTTVGITVDRYVAICHPFLARTVSTQSKAVKINIAIWIVFILLLSIFYVLGIRLYLMGYNSAVIYIVQVIYNPISSLILFTLLPMFIIIVLYVLIVRSIWKSSKLKGSSNTRGQSMAGKSLKLSVAIVVQYFVSYVPTSTFEYVESFLEGVDQFYIEQFKRGINIVKMLSATMDLVLYSLVSKRFRDAFKDMLCPSWIRRK